jgi:hypothetical protein
LNKARKDKLLQAFKGFGITKETGDANEKAIVYRLNTAETRVSVGLLVKP